MEFKKTIRYTPVGQDENDQRPRPAPSKPWKWIILGSLIAVLSIICAVLSFILLATPDLPKSTVSVNPYEGADTVYEEHDLPALSCTAVANHTNSCFVEKPGGVILLAQMYNHTVGPIDTWMIHGLWGNYCNGMSTISHQRASENSTHSNPPGSYPSDCDAVREVKDVPDVMRMFHQNFLLNYMQINWANIPSITGVNGSSADLWAHEWNKHGTCMSTLHPLCYYDHGKDVYRDHAEVVDYFQATIRLQKQYMTFDWLKECSIVPSSNAVYDLKAIEGCLGMKSGYKPRVGCNEDGLLNEIWYSMFWEGSLRSGTRVGTDSRAESNCPKEGIRYLPKEGSQFE